jgi:gamma-glutamyltranspeptidase/glutathione hydrolase
VIRNPALAETLEKIAAQGADSFYAGDNAATVAAKVGTAPRNPAPLTTADIAGYQAKGRAPVCGDYRGYRVCGMGPPSSGATTVYAILKQLERFDLKALGPDNPVSWHLIAESERLAYADRDRYLGDSDFVSVPVAGLTDPAYLATRSALISDKARCRRSWPGRRRASAPLSRRHARRKSTAPPISSQWTVGATRQAIPPRSKARSARA